jgi:hypothetical protein
LDTGKRIDYCMAEAQIWQSWGNGDVYTAEKQDTYAWLGASITNHLCGFSCHLFDNAKWHLAAKPS